MIIKGKSVIGLNIVTIDTGTVVENVDDIAYNPTTQRVEALLVSSGGLFSSAKAIHMDDVRNIGEDAVVIPDASVIQSVKDLGDSVHSISDSNKHLVKTNVLTMEGKELGKVTDIFFDSATGHVDSMEVSQGSLKAIKEGKKSIKPSDIVTIGADATIVSTYTELKFDEQAEEGGVVGIINNAKDKASEITASAKDTTKDALDKTKEKSQEAFETAKDKAADLKDTTQDKAEDAQAVIKDKSSDAKRVIDQRSEEARVRADELRDDATVKARELNAKVREKSDELKDASQDASQDLRLKADELAEDTKLRAQELQDSAKVKAEQTKAKADELSQVTKERIQNVKDENSDKIDTVHNQGRKVVKQTKEKYEDATKRVEVEKTKITESK